MLDFNVGARVSNDSCVELGFGRHTLTLLARLLSLSLSLTLQSYIVRRFALEMVSW